MNLPPQYEDPDGAASMAIWKARLPAQYQEGGKISGSNLLNFQHGWAVAIMSRSGSSHWFKRLDERVAWSLCDQTSDLDALLGPGNYPHCGNCVKTMSRLIKRGAM